MTMLDLPAVAKILIAALALPLALAARSLHVLAVPLLRTAGRMSPPKLGYATS